MPVDDCPAPCPAPPVDTAALLSALRDTQEAYRRLFELTPLPMCVRDVETMENLEVNQAALDAYGYTREEFIGLDTRALLAPEERERFRDYIARRDPALTSVYAGRWTHLRRDGSRIEAEIWSHALVFRGRAARLVVVKDVTEQLRTEEEVRLGRERFQLIASATSDAVWDWDFASNSLWWGDSFFTLFGYSPTEFGDTIHAWASAIHPDDQARVVASLETARAQGLETWREEYRFRRKNGDYATVVDRGRVVRDASGRPARMVGGMTDITEQSRLQSQYLRAQRLESIGTLAGGIAHDLNNMVAPILLATELLRLQVTAPEAVRYLDNIETSARRSAELVRQVLTFARGMDGKRKPLDLRDLVREVSGFAAETFPRNLDIRLELPGSLWTVEADPTQLNQVLLNLAVNARDAMPDGGALVFSVANLRLGPAEVKNRPDARPGPYVVLSVSDTGTGIAPDHLDRIFEPFFTTKEVGKGTGLGLATVHTIVRQHEGFLGVRSAKGSGTTFAIHLPATPDAAPSCTAPAAETPALAPGRGQTILLIDDEPALRELTQLTIERHGYRVLTASDGAEGIACYAQNRADIALVLTDMAMPVMDGPATILAIHRINAQIPIVAMSGHDPDGRQAREVHGHIRHFLPKPYSPEQLLLAIRDCLHPAA